MVVSIVLALTGIALLTIQLPFTFKIGDLFCIDRIMLCASYQYGSTAAQKVDTLSLGILRLDSPDCMRSSRLCSLKLQYGQARPTRGLQSLFLAWCAPRSGSSFRQLPKIYDGYPDGTCIFSGACIRGAGRILVCSRDPEFQSIFGSPSIS